MSTGGNEAVELAELNGVWRTHKCVCCGEKIRVNITLFPHEDMCDSCKEKMNKPNKWDEKDEEET